MKTVAVLSQGCAANFGDGEQIARLLVACGAEVIFDIDKNSAKARNQRVERDFAPDAFCLNVCTVKGDSTALGLLRKTMVDFPCAPILVTGCVPPALKKQLATEFPTIAVSDLDFIKHSPGILENWLENGVWDLALRSSTLRPNSENFEKDFAEGSKRATGHVGILNISDGCLDACTFCSTHLVKGHHKSANPEAIVEEAQKYIADGCKELWLSGQDTSCYGFDINTNLAKLAQKIIANVKGNYKMRLGMGNPRHLATYLDEMLETFQDEHIYKFIHLPVQSGSDHVLKLMGRRHSVETYTKIAKAFLNRFDYFTLSTDLIVGFPGETQEDFKQTLNVLEETRPTICNITRFVPRPGTVAAKLQDTILGSVQHDRSAELAARFQQIAQENNAIRIGEIERVLVDKPGKRIGTTIARDMAYRPVALQGDFRAGEWLDVKIANAETFALIGEIV